MASTRSRRRREAALSGNKRKYFEPANDEIDVVIDYSDQFIMEAPSMKEPPRTIIATKKIVGMLLWIDQMFFYMAILSFV